MVCVSCRDLESIYRDPPHGICVVPTEDDITTVRSVDSTSTVDCYIDIMDVVKLERERALTPYLQPVHVPLVALLPTCIVAAYIFCTQFILSTGYDAYCLCRYMPL